jgi:hypothetical protein
MSNPLFRLDGRVALVTGTSSGLGQRFAEVLDGAGASVILAARRQGANRELAGRLRDALPVGCDVRDPADRERLVAVALDRYGHIDILVNNAGIAHSGAAEDENVDVFRDQIETNTVGLFALTQLVGRHMLGLGKGSIINIASPAATVSLDRYGLAGYSASKGRRRRPHPGTRGPVGSPGRTGQRHLPVLVPDRDQRLPPRPRSGRLDQLPHPHGTTTPPRRTRRPTAVPRQRSRQLHNRPHPRRRRRLDHQMTLAGKPTLWPFSDSL